MAIEFHCPHCDKFLSTSDDKAGREAKCPGCGEFITVPLSEVAAPAVSPAPSAGESSVSSRRMKACAVCGAESPSRTEICEFCGTAFPTSSREDRPQIVDAGVVLSDGWNLFAQRWGLAIGANLLFTVLCIVAAIPVIALAIVGGNLADRAPAEMLLIALVLPTVLIPLAAGAYLLPGLTMVFLGIARGEPVDISTLFSSGRYFLRSAAASFLFFVAVAVGMMLCVAPGVYLILRYWPYLFVMVDEDASVMGSFQRAGELTLVNLGTSFVVGLVGWLVNFAANSVCPIAGLVTQPLASLWWATAYAKMTARIDDR